MSQTDNFLYFDFIYGDENHKVKLLYKQELLAADSKTVVRDWRAAGAI